MKDSTPSSIGSGRNQSPLNQRQPACLLCAKPDDFNPDSYQNSLNTIITRMSDAAVPEDGEGYKRPLHSHPGPNHLLAPLSNTVSVEPLHFLGITPTAEKAALLSACRFTFLLARIK